MINMITLIFIFAAVAFVFYKYPRKFFENNLQYTTRLFVQIVIAIIVGMLWPITIFFVIAYCVGSRLSRKQ